jgi:hypothetical protein
LLAVRPEWGSREDAKNTRGGGRKRKGISR